MLRAAIGFFIVGILFYVLGAGGVASISMELGKTLLWVFLILSVISLLVSLFTGRGKGVHSFLVFFLGAGMLGSFMVDKASAQTLGQTEQEEMASLKVEG